MQRIFLLFSLFGFNLPQVSSQKNALLYQTDFGLKDGAVAARSEVGTMMYGTTFSAVEQRKAVGYINSLLKLSFGINMGNFAGITIWMPVQNGLLPYQKINKFLQSTAFQKLRL